MRFAILAGLAVLGMPMLSSAAHVELTNGDLSGNHLSPTPVAVTPNGSTAVSGSVTGAGSGVSTDLDYFTVTIPSGQWLSGMFVRTGTTPGGNGSFLGLFQGSTATNPSTTTGANMLGYYLYKSTDIDTNILDDLATFNFMGSNPSQGFVPPLPAGNYTFWVQEGAAGTFNYNFDLVLSNVPEPAIGSLLLATTGLLALRRRNVRRS